jgi:hypothetical protein
MRGASKLPGWIERRIYNPAGEESSAVPIWNADVVSTVYGSDLLDETDHA